MNIIVCVKGVPVSCVEKLQKSETDPEREKTTQAINPYDLYALEAALEISDKAAEETKITVLSMGPIGVSKILKQIFYMGVHRIILLSDKAFAGADTLATGYTLQKAVETIGEFDLIICGQQSADGDTGQVGPILANQLQIPFLTQVQQVSDIQLAYLVCDRSSDYEYQTVKLPFPSLICVKNRINSPRTGDLRNYYKNKDREIEIWDLHSINADPQKCGQLGSATQVVEVYQPPVKQICEFITGEGAGVIDRITEIIVQKGLLNVT